MIKANKMAVTEVLGFNDDCDTNALRNLCVLCASAVNLPVKLINPGGAEDAEVSQR